MTHAQLVDRAARWLRNTLKCRCVLTEAHAGGEIVDAIGWVGSCSYLIECKTSRSDFAADQKKPWRRCHLPDWPAGVGHYRFYFAESGLLTPDDLPPAWGLLEVVGKQVIPRVTFRDDYRVPHSKGWNEPRAIDGRLAVSLARGRQPLAPPADLGRELSCLLYAIDKYGLETVPGCRARSTS